MPKFLHCQNTTRNTVIATHVKQANTYLKRLIGWLATAHPDAGSGLWISPCNAIHSVGMRFEFDALFLNKDLQVVYAIESMKPFRFSKLVKEAKTVLELPTGTIQSSGTQLGDQLKIASVS